MERRDTGVLAPRVQRVEERRRRQLERPQPWGRERERERERRQQRLGCMVWSVTQPLPLSPSMYRPPQMAFTLKAH
jgi:hypothetical protein